MKTVAILQSNYIPWKGYFDLIHEVDLFVFHDDLQYTHSDWRNRNLIMTAQGPKWLTIPAGRSEKRLICEVEIKDQGWKGKHRRLIEQSYRGAPHFEEHRGLLDFLYDNEISNLSEYNQRAIRHVAELLGIDTELGDSRTIGAEGRKTQRLISMLRRVGATRYISGPAGKDYIDEEMFVDAGIELVFKEYPRYPEYRQQFAPFAHRVTVLDLIFNLGDRAPAHIWTGEGGASGADIAFPPRRRMSPPGD